MRRLTLRFYEGKDDRLLTWLDGLRPGAQSDAIKDILRAGLSITQDGQQLAVSAAPMDTEALLDAIVGRLLSDIRQILDASLDSHLAGVVIAGGDGQTLQEDARVADALDALSAGLSLDD